MADTQIRLEAEALPTGGMLEENARLRQLLVQAGLDESQHKITEQLQRLLLGELHHRVKNTLATVQAITTQSLRNAKSLGHAEQAIASRLVALGKAHDLLLNISWANTTLRKVVSGAIEAYGKDRFDVRGMDVEIDASAVLRVAMMLNELCTNAVKYGALSNASGRVEIVGSAGDDASFLKVVWTEKGGPPVRPPKYRSFGTRLIETSFGRSQGDSAMQFDPAGMICEFRIPLTQQNPK